MALAILALALVSLLGLHARNLALVARDQNLSTAILLAQERMTQTQLAGTLEVGGTEGDFEDSYPGRYPSFRWQREILPTLSEDLRQVRVRVVWDGQEENGCDLTLFLPVKEGG